MELYKLVFPNGKPYIGITRTTALLRLKEHARKPRKTPCYRAIQKYGKENIKVIVLANCDNWELLCLAEQEAIEKHNTLVSNGKGYNITFGGEGALTVQEQGEARIARDKAKAHALYVKNKSYRNAISKAYYLANKQRHRELAKKWKEENRDKVRQLERERYAANIEKERARNRMNTVKHKERKTAYDKKWVSENKDKVAAKTRRYYDAHKEELKAKRQAREAANPEIKERARQLAKAHYQAKKILINTGK